MGKELGPNRALTHWGFPLGPPGCRVGALERLWTSPCCNGHRPASSSSPLLSACSSLLLPPEPSRCFFTNGQSPWSLLAPCSIARPQHSSSPQHSPSPPPQGLGSSWVACPMAGSVGGSTSTGHSRTQRGSSPRPELLPAWRLLRVFGRVALCSGSHVLSMTGCPMGCSQSCPLPVTQPVLCSWWAHGDGRAIMPFVPSASWQEDPLVNQRGDPQSGALVLHSPSAVRAATLCWNGDNGWGVKTGWNRVGVQAWCSAASRGPRGRCPLSWLLHPRVPNSFKSFGLF